MRGVDHEHAVDPMLPVTAIALRTGRADQAAARAARPACAPDSLPAIMESLRLAELLAGLSHVADLGMGVQPGEAARATVVAMELADIAGAAQPQDVFYVTLLQHIGCTAFAHEAAAMFDGDEIAVKRAAVRTDFGDVRDIARSYLPHLAPDAGLSGRIRAAGTAMICAKALVAGYSQANCEVASQIASRLGLGDGVQGALLDIYEQWGGGGGPHAIRGEAIAQPARLAQVGAVVSLFASIGGVEAMRDALTRRRAGPAPGRPRAEAPGADPGGARRCGRRRRRSRLRAGAARGGVGTGDRSRLPRVRRGGRSEEPVLPRSLHGRRRAGRGGRATARPGCARMHRPGPAITVRRRPRTCRSPRSCWLPPMRCRR
jgi:hypothetical protein